MVRLLLGIVVALHFTILVINTLALFILPFTYPVYVWVPICHFIVWAGFNHKCPLTIMENNLRMKLGKPLIPGFLEHYIWKWL